MTNINNNPDMREDNIEDDYNDFIKLREKNLPEKYREILSQLDNKTKKKVIILIGHLEYSMVPLAPNLHSYFRDIAIENVKHRFSDLDENILNEIINIFKDICYSAEPYFRGLVVFVLAIIASFFGPIGLYVGIGMMIVSIVTLYFSYPAVSDDKKTGPEKKQLLPIIDDSESFPTNNVRNDDMKQSKMRDYKNGNDVSNINEVRPNI